MTLTRYSGLLTITLKHRSTSDKLHHSGFQQGTCVSFFPSFKPLFGNSPAPGSVAMAVSCSLTGQYKAGSAHASCSPAWHHLAQRKAYFHLMGSPEINCTKITSLNHKNTGLCLHSVFLLQNLCGEHSPLFHTTMYLFHNLPNATDRSLLAGRQSLGKPQIPSFRLKRLL